MTDQTNHLDPKQAHGAASQAVNPDEENIRLDRWFKRHFPALSHGELQKWLRTGQVRIDGKRAESSTRLQAGQSIRLPPQLSLNTALTKPKGEGGHPIRNPDKLKALILYEDEDIVVLNKPAGLAVQGGTGLKENLDDSLMALSLDGKTRPKLVHRLDRETSGVLLIARNDYAATKLTASFRARTTRKIYWAATVGVPEPEWGYINASLARWGQTMHVVDHDSPEAKQACTYYKVMEQMPGKMAFVALLPLTGRTHQIRVHMSHIGTPILDDPFYGFDRDSEQMGCLAGLDIGTGLHLHARQLIIPHPRRGVIDVKAPLGPRMKKTWRCLGFSEKAEADFDGI